MKLNRKLLIGFLALFLATNRPQCYSLFAAEDNQEDPAAKDASGTIRIWMAGLLDAIKANDGSRTKQLIESLVIAKDSHWFAEHYDKRTADVLARAYAESMKSFEATARRLYEADLKRGSIDIHVNRYADPETTPAPIDRLFESMTKLVPLYEVAVSGKRPIFSVALSKGGGPSKIVAGDLDGYFVDTAEGIRYIPAEVLSMAFKEQLKQDYQVLSRDANGRPAVIRMKSGALTITVQSSVVYPESARAKHISGEVHVSARIAQDGRVKDATALSGPPELQGAAVDCVKKWRFEPIQIDGSPVEVETEFVLGFSSN